MIVCSSTQQYENIRFWGFGSRMCTLFSGRVHFGRWLYSPLTTKKKKNNNKIQNRQKIYRKNQYMSATQHKERDGQKKPAECPTDI